MARKTAATPASKATKKSATKKTARKSAPQAETAPKRTSRRRKPEVVEEQMSQKTTEQVSEQQEKQGFNAYDVNRIAEQAFEVGAEVGEQQAHQYFAERTLEINGLSAREAMLLAETVVAAHDVEKYEQLLRDAHAELRRRNLVAVSEVPEGRYVVRGELVEVTPTTVIRQPLGQNTQPQQTVSLSLDRAGQISNGASARFAIPNPYNR